MKNQKLVQILLICLSLVAGVCFAAFSFETGFEATALMRFSLASSLCLYVLRVNFPVALFCTALVGFKRKCNTPTMGGVKRIWIGLCEDLTADPITFATALASGEFTGAIPLASTKTMVEVEAWYDTTKAEDEGKSGGGFTQMIEFKVLGIDKDITKLRLMLYETPTFVVIEGNDGLKYLAGSKYVPLIFDTKGVIPEKGTARKEATFSAKQDGLTIPMIPMADTATFAVAP